MGCFVNNPLRSNALHTAAFISKPFTMTKHLFSLSSLLILCFYSSGSHYNLTKYTETYFPIRERLRWYNWRNTQQGSSGYLNDSDGVTNMGGSLGPPSEGSPTVGADLDDLFVSWGPIAWGIILERDVGRLDVSLFNTWKRNEKSWYHDKTKNLIPRKPNINFSLFAQAIIHRPVGALLTQHIH